MGPTMPKDQNNESIPILGVASSKTLDGISASIASAVLSTTEVLSVYIFALDSRVWIKIGADPTAVAEADDNIPIAADSYIVLPVPPNNKIAGIGGKFTYAIAQ